MRKNFITMILALTTGLCAHAQEYNPESFDVIAPTVMDNDNAPKQVGSIIYNLSTGSFYGFDNTGKWVTISTATTIDGLVEASATDSAVTNDNSWHNLATLNLPPGTWEISGSVILKTVGAGLSTTAGDMLVAVSEYSEDTTTDHTEGVTFFGTATNYVPQVRTMITIPTITKTNTGTTNKNYYLKLRKDNGGANLNSSFRIIAQRIK
ncbi:MAG: hypothetical protein AABY53_09460 [Bdellovibrionota bacterium]